MVTRKASRLFEIIQILRLARKPVTAQEIAARLEVVSRTVYRDIVALQAMRVPIEGGRGIGYILRPGFTLPPLMLSIEETEAIVLSLALIQRTGDVALRKAALNARQKIEASVPEPLRQSFTSGSLHAWGSMAEPPSSVALEDFRLAIRDERKIAIDYRNEAGIASSRVIWPIALVYYTDWANVVAWCELRQDIRTFRTDRMASAEFLDDQFVGHGEILRNRWVAGWGENPTV